MALVLSWDTKAVYILDPKRRRIARHSTGDVGDIGLLAAIAPSGDLLYAQTLPASGERCVAALRLPPLAD